MATEEEIKESNADKIAFAVDDKAEFREIYKAALIQAGFKPENIHEFEHNVPASQAFRKGIIPDVIVTDLEMGSLNNGVNLAYDAQEKAPNAKILLCSTTANARSVITAQKQSVIHAVLSKDGNIGLATFDIKTRRSMGFSIESSSYVEKAVDQIKGAILAMQMGKTASQQVGG